MNYFHDIIHTQQRMANLMKEAETARRFPSPPGFGVHLRTALGTWMIATGQRLIQIKRHSTDERTLHFIETANG